jgi:hypothetical protein
MLSGQEREAFALRVIDEVRRWPGVEMRPHASSTEPGQSDGVEFRLYGRQIGHIHGDCGVHLSLTKALKAAVVREQLAEPLEDASTAGWTMFNPLSRDDAERAIWLLRLNYVRLRRQRLTPMAAAANEQLRKHEEALRAVSEVATRVVELTQARAKPRPLPDAPRESTLDHPAG